MFPCVCIPEKVLSNNYQNKEREEPLQSLKEETGADETEAEFKVIKERRK